MSQEKILKYTDPNSEETVTMHSTKTINEERKKKPEIIDFYNSTKGGVDTFDQKAHFYTISRKPQRWPLRFL